MNLCHFVSFHIRGELKEMLFAKMLKFYYRTFFAKEKYMKLIQPLLNMSTCLTAVNIS